VSLRIVSGGLQTTIQDLGRRGHQRIGVPVGGAMDQLALRIGNLLVGNTDDDAAIEASLIGPTMTVGDAGALVAITGADLDATIDGVPAARWRPIHLPAGATLRFGHSQLGCRAYIAIAGGIEVPRIFGSHSTYLRARFGGHEGRALRAGDALAIGQPSATASAIRRSIPLVDGRATAARWSIAASLRPPYSDAPTVRLIAGAHAGALTDESHEQLFNAPFRVSSASDRMGYRLEGAALALRAPMELLSEGVAFGSVQLPPGGAPIVLMADRQTAGGYPRVGEVASVDLPLIGQLRPGDHLRFRSISLDEAQRLYLAQEQELAQARMGIALGLSVRTS
jgi:antagonist of KipI